MIHSILTGTFLKLSRAVHKPCLYHGSVDTISIFLLHQVNDFVVSAPSEEVANKVFAKIQIGFKQPLKLLGLLTMINGIDIVQSACFVKISSKTYISKILECYDWTCSTHNSPISSPMTHDKK